MAGLDDIYRTGAGAYDAFSAGQQANLDRQKTLEEIASKRLANDHSRGMNPLLQEQQRAINANTTAQLDGHLGTSMSNLAKGRVDAAGVDDAIKLKARETYGKMREHDLADISRHGQTLGQLGTYTAGMQPLERAIFLGNQFIKMGMDPESPETQRLMQLSPEQLTAVGQFMALADPKHQQAVAVEKVKEEGQMARTKANNQTQIDVANIYAKNRGGAGGDFMGYYNTKLKTARDKHAALISEAERIRGTDPETAALYERMAATIRPQAEAEIKSAAPGALDVSAATGLPGQAGPQIAPPGAKPQGQPSLEQAVKAAGQAYEPNKYDYRIDPATGRVQRKPK